VGIGSGLSDGWSLAVHISSYELPEVRRTAAADVAGLIVQVLDVLSRQLQGDGAASGGQGPGRHGMHRFGSAV
jgi:hypothetical protein